MPGPLKVREEIETEAESSGALLAILAAVGYTPVFRYEKYREEYTAAGVVVAVDETPIGTFVELEGEPTAIHALAARLGLGPADFVTASYRALFVAAGGPGTPTCCSRRAPARHRSTPPSCSPPGSARGSRLVVVARQGRAAGGRRGTHPAANPLAGARPESPGWS